MTVPWTYACDVESQSFIYKSFWNGVSVLAINIPCGRRSCRYDLSFGTDSVISIRVALSAGADSPIIKVQCPSVDQKRCRDKLPLSSSLRTPHGLMSPDMFADTNPPRVLTCIGPMPRLEAAPDIRGLVLFLSLLKA